MANEEQLAILRQGIDVWNEWLQRNPEVYVDFSKADLRKADLRGADLTEVDFRRADLSEAQLTKADLRDAELLKTLLAKANLRGANLRKADLREADLSGADLRKANLSEVDLWKANLSEADLSEADLTGAHVVETNLCNARLVGANLQAALFLTANCVEANLTGANLQVSQLIETQLQKANLSNCYIYGISAWDVNLEGAIQSNLIITADPKITVDNLEIAQFIYLLIHNEKLRDVIDTIGKKAVLILGRFNDERIAVLRAIQDELRKRDYIPILFDFEKPASRDVTETVVTLAHMARFIVADLTDAKSIPQELSHIVPDLPSVAVQPLILSGQREYGMFEHFQRYPWVLPIHEYDSQDQLLAELSEKVIAPAEAKVNELRPRSL